MQTRVKDIITIMEKNFPTRYAEDWDNAGLQIGSYDMPVHKVLVSLDPDQETFEQAVQRKVDLIITHHPFFFKGIKTIRFDQAQGKLIRDIIKADIAVYAAHTNLDSAERGLNQILSERLGLRDIQPLEKSHVEELYKLVVYVPAGHEEKVRQTINQAGAGFIGRYSDCSFRARGTGTFRPAAGTNPYIGETGVLEEVEEYRLETVMPAEKLDEVLRQMKKVHPYEEIAYDVFLLQNEGKAFSPGRTGLLEEVISLHRLCDQVKKVLGLDCVQVVGKLEKKVSKVAVVSGAGTSFMREAKGSQCDVLITGDLKYHEARDAEAMNLAIIDAGHFGTESIVGDMLCTLLRGIFQEKGMNVEISAFTGRNCMQNI